jgi:hypothetical protein
MPAVAAVTSAMNAGPNARTHSGGNRGGLTSTRGHCRLGSPLPRGAPGTAKRASTTSSPAAPDRSHVLAALPGAPILTSPKVADQRSVTRHRAEARADRLAAR